MRREEAKSAQRYFFRLAHRSGKTIEWFLTGKDRV
jgi:hypothetical protein